MKTCPVCGEDIARISSICPYCESPQDVGGFMSSPVPRTAPVRTIDLEAGLPTVDEALEKLRARLASAQGDGVRLVRIIHGWGSGTGGGGRIRAAVRRWLEGQHAGGRFRGILPGDSYSRTEPAGRNLLRRFPDLESAERQDRRNPGITFVEL